MRPSAWLVVCLLGCRTLPTLPAGVRDGLRASPGAYVSGAPGGVAAPTVLNAEDFVYDARFDATGTAVAFARLGLKQYFLSVFDLAETGRATKRFDVPIGSYEFDVEMVGFSPDGQGIATVSRDGSIRVFDARTGAARRAWLTDEPLVSLAFSPSGKWVVVGSAKGLVTVLSWPGLAYQSEVRAHADEVRGLVFAADGRLYAGGWDRRITSWSLNEAAPPTPQARLRLETTKGVAVFRTVVDGASVVATTIDTRLPLTVMRRTFAQTLGLDVGGFTERRTLPTAMGDQSAPVAKGRTVALKGLVLNGVDVAVCDACLPSEVLLALGQPELARVETVTDAATQELVVTARASATGVTAGATLSLAAGSVFSFAAAVNDLSTDAAGMTLGVAFSETKAERTREVYEREKKKEVDPERPWDVGALVDVATGAVTLKASGHHGVVATAGVSPDGKHLVTGGWDRQVRVHGAGEMEPLRFGWAVRRARFSPDGRRVLVAAWTPQNPLGNHQSDPSAVVYELRYGDDAVVVSPPR